MSYEDFVRGWRPTGDGKLALCNGAFVECITKAHSNPNDDHVIVIEEINRGNPAQIFGELLTLLETDKRCSEEALHLCHHKNGEDPLYIPPNLHIIGTMNIADRSLALVDFALRRRFAFITLEPHFGHRWQNWMTDKEKAALPKEFVNHVAEKMEGLNAAIAAELSLGSQYAIGHSYVTYDTKIDAPETWFLDIIDTEIEPLLCEYWFDNHNKVKELVNELKVGIETWMHS